MIIEIITVISDKNFKDLNSGNKQFLPKSRNIFANFAKKLIS